MNQLKWIQDYQTFRAKGSNGIIYEVTKGNISPWIHYAHFQKGKLKGLLLPESQSIKKQKGLCQRHHNLINT